MIFFLKHKIFPFFLLMLTLIFYIYFCRKIEINPLIDKSSIHYINDLYMSNELYYDNLNYQEQKLYMNLLEAINNYKANYYININKDNCYSLEKCSSMGTKAMEAIIMDHPELLQQRINTLQTAGIENPYHTLLIAHDSGMIAPDNMQMWDGSTSHGNHTVLTQAWANENGVDFKDVQAMKNLFASDGSVNTDAVNAYKNLAQHVGEDNFVSRIEDRPVIKELYGERESTYDHDPKIPTKEIDHYKKVDDYEMVRNETDLGVGMFGVLGHKIGIRTIKERIGALLDRMAKNKKTYIESTPDKNVTKYSDGNTVDKDVTKHSDGKTVDKDVTKHSDGNTIDKDVTKHSDVNTVVKIRNSNSH